MRARLLLLPLMAGLLPAIITTCFAPLPTFSRRRPNTARHGISEWRDLMFHFPGTGDDRRLGLEQGPPPKQVCILPFPYPEVLLQGETKQLRLYEDRFVQLFDDAMENHCGVVGMGLLADSGIIQTVPLCEIEAYSRMEGFGIFVTIRVVSRVQLIEINQQEPYIKAICTEIADSLPPNLELPNLVASNIEYFMLNLSSMEHRLEQAKLSQTEGEQDAGDAEKQRRINIAKLDDSFYQDHGAEGEDEEEEDDDDDDISADRRRRFQKAYSVALATDTQGYRVVSKNNTTSDDATISRDRTPQELTAISWAAFCTELLPEQEATYRIQALDSDNLFDRLKLASYMLRHKKAQLRTKLEKAGLPIKGDDMEGGDLDEKVD